MPQSTGFKVANAADVRRAFDRFVDGLDDLPDIMADAAAGPVSAASRSAAAAGRQGRAAAGGIRVETSGVPRITWGGSTPVVSDGGTVSDLAGGVEFGGPSRFPGGGYRFPRSHRPTGYHLMPTLRSRSTGFVDDVGAGLVSVWNRATRGTR